MADNNQSSFQDYQNYQNFDLDIDKIYNDFILAIDSIRSFVNISSPNNNVLLKQLTFDDYVGISSKLKIERTLQESRLHAFYRMIGFPVVHENTVDLYSPGIDLNTSITSDYITDSSIEDKINIINNPIKDFNKLSLKREQYIQDLLNIFSLNTSMDAIALTLSSYNIRKFNVLEDVSSADLFSVLGAQIESQSYNIEMFNTGDLHFSSYTDNTGKAATNLLAKRYHIILPFVVDGRIDIATNPLERRIAAPFPKNKLATKVSEDVYAKRCILEQIITERYDDSNKLNQLGTADQQLIDYFTNSSSLSAIKDEEIISQVSSNDYFKLSERYQFVKFFNLIRAMIKRLYESLLVIRFTEFEYYWLPQPSKIGPEGGCTTQSLSTLIPENLLKQKDVSLLKLQVKEFLNNITKQSSTKTELSSSDTVVDTFSSFVPNILNMLGSGNIGKDNLESLIKKRNAKCNLANKALKDIEIITGEFSGLGLCDIVAILGGLYLVDRKYLLGFLDKKAYDRAVDQLKISDDQPSFVDSSKELTKKVKDFYNLMDKLYSDILISKTGNNS